MKDPTSLGMRFAPKLTASQVLAFPVSMLIFFKPALYRIKQCKHFKAYFHPVLKTERCLLMLFLLVSLHLDMPPKSNSFPSAAVYTWQGFAISQPLYAILQFFSYKYLLYKW